MVSLPSWVPVVELAMVAVIVGSVVVVRWLDRTRDWGRVRRSRLLLGLPWGTFVCLAGVVSVYLFVQGAWAHWHSPVTVAFRSWSYFYPTGMVLAPFSHHNPGHLTGNMLGALVLGSLAEYAWGHFPEDRGTGAFSSWWTNPYVRAFVVFPGGVVVIGLLTVVFGWGPIIGFSGVVFAFAGFALLRYPIITVVALEARRLVEVVYYSALDPVVITQAQPQFVRPWWAGVAVQGHLLGLLLGVLVAAVVLRHRRLDTTRIWIATVLVATSLTIWAVWWYGGGTEYVLYRGAGVVLVFAVAALATVGARAAVSQYDISAVPLRAVGLLVLAFPVLVMGSVAVPYNLSTVSDGGVPGDGPAVTVRGYSVSYAENVTDRHVSVLNLSAFGETTAVRRSGVIVVNPSRQIWHQSVSTSALAFDGETRVRVGGVGWQESIGVKRAGWVAENNQTAYSVWLRPPGEDWVYAYESEPVVAEPIVGGERVRIDPSDDGFRLVVLRNDSVIGHTGIPEPNASVRVGRVSFELENESVYAVVDDTRVRIARRESYE